ncbi:Myc-type basic helix-loop-helix (bHLH) domain [Arabidopsis thaliana x Arabidopsis arenosa]|uniref:Transcription factor PIF6 n=7 Tax=Arabidopsis TaxID=3701 RepID=PIF6_ARATH|nr:phytochrome interacting factor 3-like 2 [Arabidopsis thaliana]Q8L5W7.1 RecName: Full=Transcription factor PIF6; AltName: Full=Basic helix-loop-helix protein 132; Short=AtbHLH132; Short=bHLH 132; AltName: Full=Phytochrome interacting factor 3-like 2; AltName: Full=Phytochrome-interacting factor 6; AltName: Full=Transcription factor EN 111; AltName: Full=bHLH transcription factor bHLH132 [Arabidopsis thaliana]KAG7629393.1 Myc-type basic helix-loop-helix (bHLH) domain [Arabidopsis thaliana x Arab|eukprot:NP_001078329.1 phytochrome interacting factor 3-like 2 [Arabidopsis thaliana]
MMFLPTDYCCRLSDQEYMELVFENGQILAKGQRSNVSLHNQRTKSIMDLYEAEYNEDFMKSIIHGGGGAITNLGDTQVVPQSHVAAAHETNMLESNKHVDDSETLKASSSKRMMVDYHNRKKIKFIPPDEQSVVADRSFKLGFDTSSVGFTEDSEGSMYLSSSLDDESDDARPQVPARTRKALVKRKRNAEAYNSPERNQRNDINKKMRTLQNLLPNSHKDDNESMLDEAINYMTNLQLQVQMMTMGNRFVTPSMMMPLGPNYSQMGLAMGVGMQMGEQQFLPAHVLGAGLPGINDSADMLRFLNHPGLMPMQNSAPFIPTENCSPQSVPPSCAAFPNQIPNPNSLSNLDGATLHKKSRKTNR